MPIKKRGKTAPAPAKVDAPVPEPRVVSAVGVCCLSLNPSEQGLAKRIEQAMSQAVTDCLQRGVSIEDSVTIKAAILEARHRVLREAGLPDD